MTEEYINLILNKLINKYEHSCISKSGSNRNLKIYLTFNAKEMPDYILEDSYKYESFIENAVSILKNKEFIDVINKNGRIFKVILNTLNIENIYKYLNKESKSNIEKRYLEILNEFANKSKLTKKWSQLIIDKIKNYKPYKSYFKNEKELTEILIVLSNLENNSKEISKRVFSARILNDSKRLEDIEGKITGILKEIDSMDSSLIKYNIVNNPSVIYIRGDIEFLINGQLINTNYLNNEIILSSNQLELLNILNIKYNKVITVENLTTFYDLKLKDYLLIYLGGYHNEIRRNLLKKIYNFNHNIMFYHIGDIDVGGFLILNHLIKKTGINFKSLYMNIDTLRKYYKYTKNLTIHDKMMLEELISDNDFKNYHDVFKYMLKNNVKLEQENIFYDIV